MNAKKYNAYWSGGVFGYSRKVVNGDFFTFSNGYTRRDIEKVRNLKVKEVVDLSCKQGKHKITRTR